MKKRLSKIIACFMAALMIVTSVPLSALAGIEDDYYALTSAISAYESKMDGSVYTDMKAAYDAYVKAKEYAYAYEYGSRSDLDLAGAANTLTVATNAMKPWTGLDMESPYFAYSGSDQSGYAGNVVAFSDPEIVGGYEEQGFKYKFVMPKNVVVLYDGTNNIKIPVMLAANNNGIAALGNDRAPLAFFPNNDEASTSDNTYFALAGYTVNDKTGWQGYYTLDKSGGPSTVNEFYWDNAAQGTDIIPGYDSYSNSTCSKDNRGEKIGNGNQSKWREYVNYLTYRSTAASLDWSDRLQIAPMGWTGRSMRWTTVGSTSVNDYHYYYSGSTNSTTHWSATLYVIDYRGVETAITNASSRLLNINGKKYVKGELDNAFEIIGALQENPQSAFNGVTDYAATARTVAKAYKDNIAAANAATVSESNISDYDALSTAITKSKSVYSANNGDGKYTADSFATFKSAYEASVAEAAKVGDDGFTSATTASALDTAYKNLNVITPASGNAGDTSYNYDSDTGVVEITGPGSTGNYETGGESPLGGNENITEVVVDSSVTEIGAHTFADDSNLTTITVPAAATYGEGAFDGCNKLRTVIITGGQVKDVSAPNAPWQQPSVKVVKLGADEKDYSVTSVGENVFTNCSNAAIYVYYNQCDIPDDSSMTFGTNPTIYGYEPSTAKDYATKFGYSFVSLGHDHIWVATVVPPTCTASGYTSYKCQYCDETKPNDNYVNALGHDYVSTVIPPSCTERGYTEQVCSRCDYSKKTNYTAKVAHSYDMTSAVPAYNSGEIRDENSTVQFKHTATCTMCGESQKTEYCQFEAAGTTTVAGTKYIVFRCKVCGGTYNYKDETPAGQHLVIYQGLSNEILSTERVNDGNYPASVPALPAAAEGHSYVWQQAGTTVTPSSVAITDDTVFIITDITITYTVTYVDEDDGYLSEENVLYGSSPTSAPALPTNVINLNDAGHQIYAWQYNGETVSPEDIKVKGDITVKRVLLTVEHNFTDTILTPATCAHEGARSRYCDDCGYTINNEEIAKLAHTVVNQAAVAATCTTAGRTAGSYCSVCNEVFVVSSTVPAKGHRWNSGVVTKEPTPYETGIRTYTCSVCKATRNEVIPKVTIAQITPSDAVANKAKVNKTIRKPSGIITVSNSKKKQMTVSFTKVPSAQNYRVMYRKGGEKKWHYSWTKGKTEYTFKNLKNGGLYEFCFAAYKKNAKGVWERGPYSSISYRYYKKVTAKKPVAGKKQMTVSWKADKNATGYEIVYGTSSKYSKGKRIKVGKSATSKTIKKLKKGKKYYVWVRALKKSGKKTYTGEYSTKKSVKIK